MRKLQATFFLLLISNFLLGQSSEKLKSLQGLKSTQSYFTSDNKYVVYSSKKKLKIQSVNSEVAEKKVSTNKGRIDDFCPLKDSIGFLILNRKSIKYFSFDDFTTISSSNIEPLFSVQEKLKQIKSINKKLFVGIDSKGDIHLYNLNEKSKVWTYSPDKSFVRGVSVSPNGDLIAVGGSSNKVQLIKVENGQLEQELDVEAKWVLTTSFDKTGEKLAIGTDKGKVTVFSLNDMKETYEYAELKNRVIHVEFSPDNELLGVLYIKGKIAFLDCDENKEVLKPTKTTKRAKSFKFDPTGKHLVVNTLFGSGVSDLVDPLLKLRDSEQRFINEEDSQPPQIYLTTPSRIVDGKTITSVELLRITGTVVDDYGVFSLKINNKNVRVKENGNFVLNVPLAFGQNEINIEAIDVNENVGIKRFVVDRKTMDGLVVNDSLSKNYLLVIGVNDYKHWPKLNNAVRDAQEVAKTLLMDYTFDREDMTLVLDSQATKTKMYESLRDLIGKVTPNDNLLIYYAGHGYFDELLNEGYWVPYEARKYTQSDYFSNSELFNILKNINSKHTFLVVDACFSGSLFASRTRGYTDNVEKFKSRWGLASGRLETVADGAYGENSPFAESFISFLKENDEDDLAVSDLVQSVKKNTSEKVNQTPIGNPLRELGDEGGEFIFHKRK